MSGTAPRPAGTAPAGAVPIPAPYAASPQAGGDPPADPRADGRARLRLWLKLLRATRTVETALRERLRDAYQATLPRFDVMAALYRHEAGLTMTELSRTLMVSNGNVTGIVDRLVSDGLLVRVPDESDRRATFVRLTTRGRQSFAEMAETHLSWVAELLAPLPAAQIPGLIQALDLIARPPAAATAATDAWAADAPAPDAAEAPDAPPDTPQMPPP